MKTDKQWQAESDARTLASAEAIKVDRPRMAAAKQAAKQILKEQNAAVNGLKKVANSTVRKKTPKK